LPDLAGVDELKGLKSVPSRSETKVLNHEQSHQVKYLENNLTKQIFGTRCL